MDHSTRQVRFGAFEFDFRARELLKNGKKCKLAGQPVEVLALLLERPGELVTREELQERLWAQDTVVDFENGLNAAINRLRQALGDDSGTPRYVETLPRRGYRFISPVEKAGASPIPIEKGWPKGQPRHGQALPALVEDDHPQSELPQEDSSQITAESAASPASTGRGPVRRWILGLAAIPALVLITGFWPLPQPVARVTPLTLDARGKGAWLAVHGGRVLYTASELGADNARSDLWSVPLGGGEPRREPTPCARNGWGAELRGASYLQQRLFLLCYPVAFDGQLWVQGFDGSNPKWIGRYYVRDQAVYLSPDFKTLLFSRADGLFAKPVDGGAERMLTGLDGRDCCGVFWRPSGERIGLVRAVDGVEKLWEIDTKGTGLKPLLPEFGAEQGQAQWSPDGLRLYFVSQGDIYVRASRGWLGWMRQPKPVRLTSGPARFHLPHEDPANPLVVYSVGQIPQATAMKLNRKSDAWEPFLDGTPRDCVAYSPDGQWIVYVDWPKAALWKCRRDGSGKVLLEDRLFCANPIWSPDGTRIAFAASEDGGPFHIYTVSADGGKSEPVPGVPGPAFDPTWSPDGKRLVFAPLADQGTKEQRHVSIVNLETGTVEAVPGSNSIWSTRWSPDGKWLIGNAQSENKYSVVLYNFATRTWTELWPTVMGFYYWTKDSRYVFCGDDAAGENRLMRIEPATRKVEEVRKFAEFPLAGVLDTGIFWTPDEEPIVLKDVSSTQIYRIERNR